MVDDLVGRTLLHFRVLERLGAGGMGVVYRATDNKLRRQVAIKLLSARYMADERNKELIVQEARSAAALTHPNIAAIYEVQDLPDAAFYVMELVEGETLRQRIARTGPLPIDDAVRWACQIAHALARAHEAGVIHRDLKSDNVMIARSGDVKLLDFGLAKVIDVVEPEPVGDGLPLASAPTLPVRQRATDGGRILGTPSYMAPEQARGEEVDARADVFAFGIVLYEMLAGRLPFVRGAGVPSADADSGDWTVATPLRALAPRVPRAIEQLVERCVAFDAAERWRDGAALFDAIAAIPKRTRRFGVGAALAGVAAVAAGTVWLATSHEAATDPCAGAAARTAGAWDDSRRIHIAAHVAAVDPNGGPVRFANAAAVLDRYASDWRAMHVDACRAYRVTGAQSAILYDRRMRCLDRRLNDLGDAANRFATARDAPAIDGALVGVHQLTSLAGCADADALLAVLPPPEDPVQRHAVEAADAELDAVERDQRAGHLDGLDARAATAVEHARATHHAPVLSRALRIRASLLSDTTHYRAAADVLRELTEVAAQAHDDDSAVWAWATLLDDLSSQLGQADQALTLLPAARAAVLRVGNNPKLRAIFLFAEALVLAFNQNVRDALARLDEARRGLEGAGAGTPESPLTPQLADTLLMAAQLNVTDDHPEVGETLARRAVALYQSAFGSDHPETAQGWQRVAEALRLECKWTEAVAVHTKIIQIFENRVGDGPMLAEALVQMAAVLPALDRNAEALAHIDRALRILRATADASDLQIPVALTVRAEILDALDRLDEGRAAVDEAIARFQQIGESADVLPEALSVRGELAERQGHCDRALPEFARATALIVKYRGAEHSGQLQPLVGSGRCLVELRRPVEAMAPLDRALALHANDPDTLAEAQFFRGRALYESGRDRAEGIRIAISARVDFAKSRSATARRALAAADAWLAGHAHGSGL